MFVRSLSPKRHIIDFYDKKKIKDVDNSVALMSLEYRSGCWERDI